VREDPVADEEESRFALDAEEVEASDEVNRWDGAEE
jgi:hypothetical protein